MQYDNAFCRISRDFMPYNKKICPNCGKYELWTEEEATISGGRNVYGQCESCHFIYNVEYDDKGNLIKDESRSNQSSLRNWQ